MTLWLRVVSAVEWVVLVIVVAIAVLPKGRFEEVGE